VLGGHSGTTNPQKKPLAASGPMTFEVEGPPQGHRKHR
jgi:hypothetical protein